MTCSVQQTAVDGLGRVDAVFVETIFGIVGSMIRCHKDADCVVYYQQKPSVRIDMYRLRRTELDWGWL